MYIKAEQKENADVRQGQEAKGSPKVEPKNKQGGLISRRSNAPEVGPLSSMQLLHKPHSPLSPTLYSEEEIAKNTDMNRRLASVDDATLAHVSSKLADFGLAPLVLPPIYKKSGELVKSSLKKRSQSLPTSPQAREVQLQLRPQPTLKRSKSVHFDQRTPVKYFELDESPLDVSHRKGEMAELSFQHKGVGLFGQPQAPTEPPPEPEPPKPLRKSKRFDALNRQRQHKMLGLYHTNFPVISSRDPKVLQLNVFLSLSRDKKVFLRDLALHISRIGACVEGKVLVKNLCYHKRVVVRYTWDQWQHVHEVECVYVCSGDRFLPGSQVDLFSFVIEKPPGRRNLQLCVHYLARPEGPAGLDKRYEFWDNNNGLNYELDVVTEGFRDPFA
ncbi:GIP2 (YER054C) and PIG2 (YIL045W) [Zygosaccharomyces parabailii]|nr:GIP2 (YER054C) and PIG2 (YIL045W) [Zygosaccharomyces parabailii]CDH14409.1 uncharacterized protein ZBAI_06195 [Zygosaccharomyces bailii ISA1307]